MGIVGEDKPRALHITAIFAGILRDPGDSYNVQLSLWTWNWHIDRPGPESPKLGLPLQLPKACAVGFTEATVSVLCPLPAVLDKNMTFLWWRRWLPIWRGDNELYLTFK